MIRVIHCLLVLALGFFLPHDVGHPRRRHKGVGDEHEEHDVERVEP